MIRFYGVKSSLIKWRELLNKAVGKLGNEIQVAGHRHYFDVDLSLGDRAAIQKSLWHALSGTGETATKRPYRWNDCVTFEERK